MRVISPSRPGRTTGYRLLLAAVAVVVGLAAKGQESAGNVSSVVTNIAQLWQLSAQGAKTRYAIRLEGNVWWANPARRKLVLHDQSGTAELEMDFQSQPVQSGQRVRLEGIGTITRRGADFRIGAGGSLPGGDATLLRLEVIGRGVYPDLRWIAIGQPLLPGDEDPWAEVEGEVTLVSEQPDGLHMELSAMGGHMRVEVGDVSGLSGAGLLHRRIRAIGFCQSAFTTTGQKVPGVLLVPSARWRQWQIFAHAHHRHRRQPDETRGSRAGVPRPDPGGCRLRRVEPPRVHRSGCHARGLCGRGFSHHFRAAANRHLPGSGG
jgi:hypothetical protein